VFLSPPLPTAVSVKRNLSLPKQAPAKSLHSTPQASSLSTDKQLVRTFVSEKRRKIEIDHTSSLPKKTLEGPDRDVSVSPMENTEDLFTKPLRIDSPAVGNSSSSDSDFESQDTIKRKIRKVKALRSANHTTPPTQRVSDKLESVSLHIILYTLIETYIE
jgi:hypothetical protein